LALVSLGATTANRIIFCSCSSAQVVKESTATALIALFAIDKCINLKSLNHVTAKVANHIMYPLAGTMKNRIGIIIYCNTK
jgi:hypothetical protein